MTSGRGAFADPPRRERPTTPGRSYGVPQRGGKFIDWSFVCERLTSERNYWVATVGPNGRPHAVPIWGVFVGDDLFLETDPATRKGRSLARNPAVVVHLDDGERAVIVEGRAAPLRPDGEQARRIATAFASKYPGYAPAPDSWSGGGLYVVEPEVVFAWRDMPTATRWRFPARGGR